ncbi:MAG: biotin--[acetyl-CoA-carboxylase] ligase [SAR324 cluster bacterium]
MLKLGQTIVRVDETASTNSLVLANERYLDQHGLVVVARRQTAGRGRMGRAWLDLPGEQLFASIVVHPRLAAADTPAVALIAGLAVAQAIRETAGLDARLKWPNDVLIRGRKVCGILVESSPGRTGAPRLVIGVGVNCQGDPDGLPPDLGGRATALSPEAGRPIPPEAVLQALLTRLDALLARLSAHEKAELLIEWARVADVTGRRVQFPVTGGRAQGIVQGITPEGYLVVEDVAGLRHLIVSSEVEWKD